MQRYLALIPRISRPKRRSELVNTEARIQRLLDRGDRLHPRQGGRRGARSRRPDEDHQIKVIAAQTPFGWQRVTGLVQYTAIFEKLDEA